MSSKKNKTQKKINKKKVFIALTICILVALIGGVDWKKSLNWLVTILCPLLTV